MALTYKTYEFTLIGGNRQVKLPAYYDDINTYIGAIEVGATPAGGGAPTTSTAPKARAEELYIDGLFAKVILSVRKAAGKYRRTTVYCPTQLVTTAMPAIEGKNFGTGLAGGALKVLNAYFPRRRIIRY